MSDKYFSLRDSEAGEHIATLKVSTTNNPTDEEQKAELKEKISVACAEHFDANIMSIGIVSDVIPDGGNISSDVNIMYTIDDNDNEMDVSLELSKTWIY